MGKTLKKLILNTIENNPRGYSETLASVSGYSNGSNLKKVLRDEKKEFDKFNGLVELVRFLFDEDEQKLMEQYSKEIDPNNKTARAMLEYLSSNRLLTSMKELIDTMMECKNKESREFARVYSIQWDWQSNYHKLDIDEILKRVNNTLPSIPELNTLINILRCNCFYRKRHYKTSFELSKDIEISLEDIKEEYMKKSFSVKFNEIMSYLTLRVHNNVVEASKHAQNVIELNIGKTFNAYAEYIIGTSNLFTSYDVAKEHVTKSVKIYEFINRKEAANDVREILELLDTVWDKGITEVKYSKEFRSYWAVKNKKEVVDNELDEPYQLLVDGMKNNDTNLLMQSIISFVKRGDSFMATLPKIELLKRGYSEVVINDIMNIHVF